MYVFVTRIFYTFGNDNINYRIGDGDIILKGIDNGNGFAIIILVVAGVYTLSQYIGIM